MESEISEFAPVAIPDDKLTAWPRVAAVAAMVSFSLPTFITGLEVFAGMPPLDAILAVFVGSVIITLVGMTMGAIGAQSRMSSYLLVRIAFGDLGAGLVNIAFAISLLGWFGINVNLFAEAAARLALDEFGSVLNPLALAIFASVCMTVTTLVGFKAINLLASALVPVLALVTGLLVIYSLSAMPLGQIMQAEVEATLSLGEGISAVVGAIIVGAIILPDITRFVRHWSGAIYTAVIAYLIVELIVMVAAGFAAIVHGKTDILDIMLDINLGLGAFAIVIAGSWVLNSLNLYSTVLSVNATFPKLNAFWLTIGLGAFGVGAALLNLLDSFVTFLFYLSVVFIPVAGVIIVDRFIIRPDAYVIERLDANQRLNIAGVAAWFLGAILALLATEAMIPTLTGIAAIDAIILTAVVFLALGWSQREARAA